MIFPKKKAYNYGMILLIILMMGLLAACSPKDKVENKEVEKVAVETVQVKVGDITQTLKVSGKIAPQTEINLMPKMPGIVASVNVKVGDYVRAGQVLATLENSEYQAQLNQANASYSMASSAYADAAKNLERMRSLYSEGAVALNQVEQAELNLESKSLEGARAALTMAQSNYDNTIFKSPINGQVAEVNLVQGVMAGAQQSSIRIIDAKKVKMAATVSEAFINKVEKNQVVDVLVASTGNVPYKGRITTVAPAANSQTLTFPIEITIDNSQGILKPGMFAEINLPIDTAMAAITVPKEALINNMGNYRVFVIAAGKSYLKDVIIGLQSDTDVEIKSGLSADQRVVIKGGDKLQEGTLVLERKSEENPSLKDSADGNNKSQENNKKATKNK